MIGIHFVFVLLLNVLRTYYCREFCGFFFFSHQKAASAKLLPKTEEELAKTKEKLKAAEAHAAAVAKVTAVTKPTVVVDLPPQLSLMELALKTFADHAAIVELVNSSARKSVAYTQETNHTLEARQSDFKREEALLEKFLSYCTYRT